MLLPGVCRGVENEATASGIRQRGIQTVKLQKVHFIKILYPDQGCTIFCER